MEKKKELFYRENFGRGESLVKHMIWGVFALFASPCRMLIEVVIRKDFGERYFRLSGAVTTFVFLAAVPLIWLIWGAISRFATPGGGDPDALSTPGGTHFYAHYIAWYLYLALFLLMCLRHHRAQKRSPSVFDFARYSLSSGRIHDAFLNIEIGGKKGDPRIVECWLEPALFFLGGLLLALIGQYLGWLLMFSAVVYAISYRAAYNEGDNDVMDTIDQMIIGEERAKTFLDDADGDETRGYRFLGRKPGDPDKRKAVFDRMTNDDTPVAR